MQIQTLRTMRGTDHCPDVHTCPSIHRVAEHEGRLYVITTAVTDPETLAAFAPLMGPGEQLGWAPDALIPEA